MGAFDEIVCFRWRKEECHGVTMTQILQKLCYDDYPLISEKSVLDWVKQA
jgi:hypothetical protein